MSETVFFLFGLAIGASFVWANLKSKLTKYNAAFLIMKVAVVEDTKEMKLELLKIASKEIEDL